MGRSCPTWSAGEVVDDHRLAYVCEAPVNWCPGLGTVLANEEVTADGRSERGNFPVFKRSLKQWMMRITAYGDRLLDDLDALDWPEPVKLMQRNWIGRSTGAHVDFPIDGAEPIPVFTTRPDTAVRRDLHGAGAGARRWSTRWSPAAWPEGTRTVWTGGHATPAEAVAAYRARGRREDRRGAHRRGARRRPASSPARTRPTRSTARRSRSSSPTTCWPATAPARSWRCPARTSGTGSSPRSSTCRSSAPCSRRTDFEGKAYVGEGPAINSTPTVAWTAWASPRPRRRSSPGWRATGTARARPPTGCATGCSAGSATGASRSRSSTTRPACRSRCPSRCCRSSCPRSTTSRRARSTRTTRTATPETPLSRATRLGRGRAGPGRRAEAVHPRDQHDAAVGRLVLVRAALPGPAQRRGAGRPGERALLDGPAADGRLRRRRPVRRRRRARRAAPAVRAVLAQGAVRPGPRLVVRAVPAAVQPGLHPGVRVHATRRGVHVPAEEVVERDGGYFYGDESRSTASTARWASR